MAVFFYDLLRTSRRGRVVLLRVAYGLALLAALYHLQPRYVSGPVLKIVPRTRALQQADQAKRDHAKTMARFAEEFTGMFLSVQLGAVLLLTPAYTAGAIAEERQRGTLDCLLTTHLTPLQIVLGKLGSRLTHLSGVLLTGLPVLALLPLWGGVSPEVILCGFAVNGLTMLTVGSLGICTSARARTVRGAVASTYLVVGVSCLCLWCACINPLMGTALFDNRKLFSGTLALAGLTMAVIVNLPLAAVFVHVAVRGLAPRRRVAPKPGVAGARGLPADFHTGPWPYPDMVYPSPPVSDRPLLWKEMFVGGSGMVRVVMLILQMFIFIFVVSLAVLLAIVGGLGSDVEARDKLHDTVVVVIVVGLAAAMLGTLLQATMSVGREREERTLDMLLTLPGGRGDVLRSKWLGSVLCTHLLPVGLLSVVVVGVIGGGMPWLAVPAIVVAAAVHLAFAASLGLFLSVTIRSTARAGLIAALVLFLVCLVPSVAIPGRYATIPPVTWVACLPPTIDSINATVLVGLMVYAGLAGVLWRLARARFLGEAERAAIV